MRHGRFLVKGISLPLLNGQGVLRTARSTRVRIGLFSDERHVLDDRSLEEALANEIAGIAAYTLDENKHTPSVTSPIQSTPKKSKKSKKTRKKTKNRR